MKDFRRLCNPTSMFILSVLSNLMSGVSGIIIDALTFLRLTFRSPEALAAENLFLRKQLSLYTSNARRSHGGRRIPFASRWPNSRGKQGRNDRRDLFFQIAIRTLEPP